MSKGFGGSLKKESDYDGKVRINIQDAEVAKLLKEYKKAKKYQKSSLYQVSKLDGKETYLDRLVNKYGNEDCMFEEPIDEQKQTSG